MLDFLDRCEEMAADYGCLPQVIIAMPWVHLKRIMDSADKRRARNWRFQAALRNMELAQDMTMMLGGGAVTSAANPERPAPSSTERQLDPSTRITVKETRDASDPEGAGVHQEQGDADDWLYWVKMKAQGYPVTLVDRTARRTG